MFSHRDAIEKVVILNQCFIKVACANFAYNASCEKNIQMLLLESSQTTCQDWVSIDLSLVCTSDASAGAKHKSFVSNQNERDASTSTRKAKILILVLVLARLLALMTVDR